MSDDEKTAVGGRSKSEPLIFRRAIVARRLDALFRAMSTDFLLREQFITDPAQITSEYVYGVRMSPQRASISNQLVYSIMSNRKLFGWLRNYTMELRDRPPSRSMFIRDFGRAVVEHRAQHVVLALIRSSVEKEDILDIDEALLLSILRGRVFGPHVAGPTGGPPTGGPPTGGPPTGGPPTGGPPTGGPPTGGPPTGGPPTGGPPTGGPPGERRPGDDIYAVTLEALIQYATQLLETGALEFIWGE